MKRARRRRRAVLDRPRRLPGRRFRFPFDIIEIGEHFIANGMRLNIMGPYKKYAENRLLKKYTTSLIKDESGKSTGTAVWRTV